MLDSMVLNAETTEKNEYKNENTIFLYFTSTSIFEPSSVVLEGTIHDEESSSTDGTAPFCSICGSQFTLENSSEGIGVFRVLVRSFCSISTWRSTIF